MSHITTIDIEVSNLDALDLAAKELGGLLQRNKTTYNWYGATPQPCAHAISLPGVHYEVGVCPRPQKPGTYSLNFDPYGSGTSSASRHDGQRVLAAFGEELTKLRQLYGVHTATLAAKKKGYLVTRKQVGHNIKLQITV
jgi:hypothetical protein